MSNAPLELRPTAHTRPGIVVLSSSLRLLFVDRQASTLIHNFDSPTGTPDHETDLPACLLTVAQKIADALSSHRATSRSESSSISQFVDTRSDRLHIQGFGVPHERNDSRIVLLLSPHP